MTTAPSEDRLGMIELSADRHGHNRLPQPSVIDGFRFGSQVNFRHFILGDNTLE